MLRLYCLCEVISIVKFPVRRECRWKQNGSIRHRRLRRWKRARRLTGSALPVTAVPTRRSTLIPTRTRPRASGPITVPRHGSIFAVLPTVDSNLKAWSADGKAGGFIGPAKIKTCNEPWHQTLHEAINERMGHSWLNRMSAPSKQQSSSDLWFPLRKPITSSLPKSLTAWQKHARVTPPQVAR